ncbi:MFS transporter [Pseudomonas aeruginosa]|uniref:MFS transporter n=1 Tax=Pseudomonas aeruginosa TaxID=287 RepID=UPI00244D57C8|nr:MFS transporter [Pseudomonas aeruginosa]MDG9818776.1 MHS family MFS transporter [Pseudomonas aeruginosa]MDG9933554.1 MHS family MFS transporter [Pseudomonas aeruginosa]MDH0526815.1 MHS family MFS transporter [Pseudomonas aeruginosa]MDH0532594.1 MHS family MFS transporter [Pseudomonas aeruginosa]HDQ4608392.1 MHS family MFS transporter [Pseudomonas aeruginosa]
MSSISQSVSSLETGSNDVSLNKRVLVASLTGSAIEWFDYFLYGTVASLVFNRLFFPNFDPVVGLLLTYLSFSLTFFVRPFGGFLFSHIGDRIGRKKTLVITLSLMGFATFGIGLLPGYDAIGIWAPILLIVLRVIQGLGISGEWGGALLLAYEYAPKGKRGLYGSVPQMGVPLGMVMATLAMTLVSLLPDEDFLAWGWRIPFLLSAVLVLLGLWIRNGIDETPDFKEAKKSGEVAKIPLVDTVKYHWREVLIATGAKVVESAPFYIFTTFIVGYATGTLQLEKMTVLNAVSVASVVTVCLIPVMGALSDRIGRKRVFMIGATLMAVFAFPYFYLLDLRSSWSLTFATVIAVGLIWAPIVATLGTFMSEIFSTRVRYTGITLGAQLGAAFAGGTAPLIATWLQAQSGGSWVSIAVYLMLCAVISIVAVSCARGANGNNH